MAASAAMHLTLYTPYKSPTKPFQTKATPQQHTEMFLHHWMESTRNHLHLHPRRSSRNIPRPLLRSRRPKRQQTQHQSRITLPSRFRHLDPLRSTRSTQSIIWSRKNDKKFTLHVYREGGRRSRSFIALKTNHFSKRNIIYYNYSTVIVHA